MTKTKIKALSVFLVIAVLLVAVFVANVLFAQRAFAEESDVGAGQEETLPDGNEQGGDDDNKFVETSPEDTERGNGIIAFLLENMLTLIIVGVVIVTVILPLIVLGIVASVKGNRK